MPHRSDGARARRRQRTAAVAVAALLLLPGVSTAEPLGLTEALSRAAAQDPRRPAAAARLRAAEAAVHQAGVKPNPSLGVDVENIAGTGPLELADRTETTVFYEQTFERGGKLQARTGAARAEVAVARLKGQAGALDFLAMAQGLWVEAAAAQASVSVAEERLAVAHRLERETARRVNAARDPLFAGERARTAVIQAQIALDQAKDAARNGRAALGAYLGEPLPEIDPAGFDALGASEAGGPGGDGRTADVALREAERDAALARVRIEETRAVRDPTVRAGVRHFREGGDVAFVVGGSIPLGRHDTNRGNIDRARAERLAAESEAAAARTERDREVARLIARRAATAAEVRRIDAEVSPSAGRAVALVRDGYNRGGGAFTFLEVAEAQRALIDARARRVELLKAFHLDGARLDRLTDRHAALIAPLTADAETR